MVALNRYILFDLDIIDALENGESVADAGHPHLLEIVMLQSYQGFADDFVFFSLDQHSEITTTQERSAKAPYL